MGGYGSGRWGTSKRDAKTLADGCLALDMKLLTRAGVVRPHADHRGSWLWGVFHEDDKPSSVIGFKVKTGAEDGTIRLEYSVKLRQAGGDLVPTPTEYSVALITTGLPSGGRRWWFLCRAMKGESGPPCSRRVGKIFLPRGGRVFACRHCYELAYESSRLSSKGNAMWSTVGAAVGISGAEALKAVNDGPRRRRRSRDELGQRAIFKM